MAPLLALLGTNGQSGNSMERGITIHTPTVEPQRTPESSCATTTLLVASIQRRGNQKYACVVGHLQDLARSARIIAPRSCTRHRRTTSSSSARTSMMRIGLHVSRVATRWMVATRRKRIRNANLQRRPGRRSKPTRQQREQPGKH